MNDSRQIGQSEIGKKIKEAEICYSMGMMRDALQVYEQVLANLPGKDGETRETVVARIDLLKKDIEDREDAENKGFSKEEISLLKKHYPPMMMCQPFLTARQPCKNWGWWKRLSSNTKNF